MPIMGPQFVSDTCFPLRHFMHDGPLGAPATPQYDDHALGASMQDAKVEARRERNREAAASSRRRRQEAVQALKASVYVDISYLC